MMNLEPSLLSLSENITIDGDPILQLIDSDNFTEKYPALKSQKTLVKRLSNLKNMMKDVLPKIKNSQKIMCHMTRFR